MIDSNYLNGITITTEIQTLHQTIKEFNDETKKYSKQMLYLTWVITGLTVVLVIGLIIQICLAV